MRPYTLPMLLFLALALPLEAPAAGARAPAHVGIALGSGGAGGLAHIAMLEVFDDLGIRPACIAGTSIGAVIGSLYAAGLPAKEIRKVFQQFAGSNLDVLSSVVMGEVEIDLGALMNLDLDNGGLIDAEGFVGFLAEQTEARSFADLKIPLQVVATDFWSGDSVVLSDGDLFEAVKASMAVPGMFSPVERGGRLLIDGGTSNPLPWDLLAECADLVVAVDVSTLKEPDDGAGAEMLDVLFGTFSIMQRSLVAEKRRRSEPDIFVRPDTTGVRLLHFNRIDQVLEQARPEAERLREALDQST